MTDLTKHLPFIKSVLELALLTWITTFIGTVTAAGFDLMNISAYRAAAVSAIPAAVAAVYGFAVRRLGNSDSALAAGTRQPGSE